MVKEYIELHLELDKDGKPNIKDQYGREFELIGLEITRRVGELAEVRIIAPLYCNGKKQGD